MKTREFGTMPGGRKILSYTLTSENASVDILSYGAVIQRFEVYGIDIVGGFDKLESYFDDPSHQGGVVGRVANRVEDASFVLNGKTYYLPKNEGENCLHGGRGFDRRAWDVVSYTDNEIELYYYSPDGEEGFPGNLDVYVKYTLCATSLSLSYRAIPTNRPTPISLTNHVYFNLDGLGGTVLDHTAQFFANTYTEVTEQLIPTGNRPSVDGTVFDLREPRRIGDAISDSFIGYDNNFILSPTVFERFGDKELGLGAIVKGKQLSISVYTDQPCIQFYIGNFLSDTHELKGGIPPIRHGALCLETQTEQNGVKHGRGIYNPGEEYIHTVVYKVDKV